MILFNKEKVQIRIYSKKELKQLNKAPKENLSICENFYLDPSTSVGDLASVLDLEEEGTYDLAVPQEWATDNDFPTAIWFYSKKSPGSLVFGRPMLLGEMMERLRKVLLIEAMVAWNQKVLLIEAMVAWNHGDLV